MRWHRGVFQPLRFELLGGAVKIQTDGGLGRGLLPQPHFRIETFQQQKEECAEHIKEGYDLENAALAGEHKQGCDDGTQQQRPRRFHFQPCMAVRAREVSPGIQVEKKRRPYTVIANGACCHWPYTFPFLYPL